MTIPMKAALYCALAFAAYALIASTYRDAHPPGCITVPGGKGTNGGGDGGSATICGTGLAIGGEGGNGR